jgi:uncharacterized protein YgfB (UPF0149 family)
MPKQRLTNKEVLGIIDKLPDESDRFELVRFICDNDVVFTDSDALGDWLEVYGEAFDHYFR